MRTVLSVSLEKGYVVCKDKPSERVSLDDIELLRHMGVADSSRKGIYEGDIVSVTEGGDTHIGVMAKTEAGDWFIHMPETGIEVPFPWNKRNTLKVLGNKFENGYYLTDEYARRDHMFQIIAVLSSHDICTDKFCRHDLEKAIAGLSELSKEELIEMVQLLARSLRECTKAYYGESSSDRHR